MSDTNMDKDKIEDLSPEDKVAALKAAAILEEEVMTVAYPYGFQDDEGRTHYWNPGDIVHVDDVAMLEERGVELIHVN
jgi:hypothetical protein